MDAIKDMLGWRGKDEFVENTQKKKVLIHRNGYFEDGKVIFIEAEWTMRDFFVASSNRLDISPVANRVFNGNGIEIDDCLMIEDDDILFLSNNDSFIQPNFENDNHHNGSKPSDFKLPPSVGSYRVGEMLGKGGFGEVRAGIHQLTNERVALKFLKKSEIQSIGAAERTATEIQCLTTLQHPGIIRLQQHVELHNFVVLVFELMEGGDLLRYLLNRGSIAEEQALSEDDARRVFLQVIGAVGFAHNQHICHRDLKLENILLKDQSLGTVKIADFGLSGFYRPGAVMKSDCGTLSFLAPEVFKGTANLGPPLDVWSMGVVLFAILCGRLPFEGSSLSGSKRPRDSVIVSRITKSQFKLEERLSMEAKDLVRRMLRSDPLERASLPDILNHAWVKISSQASTVSAKALLNSTNRFNKASVVTTSPNLIPIPTCTPAEECAVNEGVENMNGDRSKETLTLTLADVTGTEASNNCRSPQTDGDSDSATNVLLKNFNSNGNDDVNNNIIDSNAVGSSSGTRPGSRSRRLSTSVTSVMVSGASRRPSSYSQCCSSIGSSDSNSSHVMQPTMLYTENAEGAEMRNPTGDLDNNAGNICLGMSVGAITVIPPSRAPSQPTLQLLRNNDHYLVKSPSHEWPLASGSDHEINDSSVLTGTTRGAQLCCSMPHSPVKASNFVQLEEDSIAETACGESENSASFNHNEAQATAHLLPENLTDIVSHDHVESNPNSDTQHGATASTLRLQPLRKKSVNANTIGSLAGSSGKNLLFELESLAVVSSPEPSSPMHHYGTDDIHLNNDPNVGLVRGNSNQRLANKPKPGNPGHDQTVRANLGRVQEKKHHHLQVPSDSDVLDKAINDSHKSHHIQSQSNNASDLAAMSSSGGSNHINHSYHQIASGFEFVSESERDENYTSENDASQLLVGNRTRSYSHGKSSDSSKNRDTGVHPPRATSSNGGGSRSNPSRSPSRSRTHSGGGSKELQKNEKMHASTYAYSNTSDKSLGVLDEDSTSDISSTSYNNLRSSGSSPVHGHRKNSSTILTNAGAAAVLPLSSTDFGSGAINPHCHTPGSFHGHIPSTISLSIGHVTNSQSHVPGMNAQTRSHSPVTNTHNHGHCPGTSNLSQGHAAETSSHSHGQVTGIGIGHKVESNLSGKSSLPSKVRFS